MFSKDGTPDKPESALAVAFAAEWIHSLDEVEEETEGVEAACPVAYSGIYAQR